MKTPFLSTMIMLTFASAALGQMGELGFNYAFTAPTGGMKNNILYGNGVTFDFGLVAPSQRLAAGLEVNVTQYGHDNTTQNYTFSDGTQADMSIVVNNSFVNVMAFTRLYLITSGPWRPYVSAKAGYAWYNTRLNIYDPEEDDSCVPIDSEILQHDGTLVYSIGAGMRFDLSYVFKRMRRDNWYFDVGSNILQGGKVNYMSNDSPNSVTTHTGSPRAQEIQADFLNTQTMVIHEHHVGYVYTNFVQMLDFRVGVSWRVNLPSRRSHALMESTE